MSATTAHTTEQPPEVRTDGVVRRHLRWPDDAGDRAGEGGLRLRGVFKSSLPRMPLVTVITVCRNAADTIRQTLQSVFAQSYGNIEYLVIDGRSEDATMAIVEEFADRIDYFVSERDAGIYAAMNKGLALATGEYVLMLNSDDWYAPDCVETLVRARWCSGASFSAALAQYVDAEGNVTRLLRHMPFDASTRMRMPLRHETMLIPASIYDRLGGYDERFRIISDLEFTARLYDAGCSLFEVQRPLLYFRETGVSNVERDVLFAERTAFVRSRFTFLTDEQAAWFSRMDRLTPDHLDALAARYGQQADLMDALSAYALDRRSLGERRWSEATGVFFAALDERPGVTIVLPLYNAGATLEACLDSILAQTLGDFEVICLNDCSSDDSQAIVDRYARHDHRIRSVANERNLGLGATRNRGIRLARGEYVFHVDPDDTIPREALQRLVECARRHGSVMVKGSYLRRQFVHGGAGVGNARTIDVLGDGPELVNTNLGDTPGLLHSTEGHWSYLYRREFARRIPYPEDLRMGQDSIFLVHALMHTPSISVIHDVVYHYNANPQSAMNTFTLRKHLDAIEWRRRAHHALTAAGFEAVGRHLLVDYWGEALFVSLVRDEAEGAIRAFFPALREALIEAGVRDVGAASGRLGSLFHRLLEDGDAAAAQWIRSWPNVEDPSPDSTGRAVSGTRAGADDGRWAALRVASWSSFDTGGAGTGTQRRVASLRAHGVDARIFALVKHSGRDYVTCLPPHRSEGDDEVADVWSMVRELAVIPASTLPGFRARELFSLPVSVIRLPEVAGLFDAYDIVHLHWVVGMLDLENLGRCWKDKPVVWTLADMNAFTGGCHYSEGCEGYRDACRACPLIGGGNAAHEAWMAKKAAYAKLRNLQIVCPSRWLAEKARQSSLFGDRAVHYVPNAFPVDEFTPVDRAVARARLRLPFDKRLLIFGADNLSNPRKGGDLLRQSLLRLEREGKLKGVEVVVFGSNKLDLPVAVHPLGYVTDPQRLSLAYAAADVYLFPSREDNAPLTVGEAMLCGTPVVAYPVGHVPDLVVHGETGYIAEYGNTADFANGILQLLAAGESEQRSRSMACHVAARSFHDPEVSVARHLRVYEAALTVAQSQATNPNPATGGDTEANSASDA